MKKMYLLSVLATIWLVLSTSSYATELPKACQNTLLSLRCQSNSDLEFALENDLWQGISTGNFTAVSAWQSKIRTYLVNVKGLSNKNRSRLHALMAFSQVGMYVQGSIFDPMNLTRVIDARVNTGLAVWLNGSNINANLMNNYLNAYIGYSMYATTLGDYHVNALYDITTKNGPIVGSEGEIVGAMAQMLLVDENKVRQGLDTLKDCTTVACSHPLSLAPYKEVGIQIGIAEGYARLGDTPNMQAAFNRAKAYAQQHNHPYPQLVDAMQHQLTDAGGIIDQWKQNKHLGDIKLPLPPSAGALACQVCHATARQTINYFK